MIINENQTVTTILNVNKSIGILIQRTFGCAKTLYLHNDILKCTTTYGKNNSLPPHDQDER